MEPRGETKQVITNDYLNVDLIIIFILKFKSSTTYAGVDFGIIPIVKFKVEKVVLILWKDMIFAQFSILEKSLRDLYGYSASR
jgi:hypothetical protein